MHKVHLILVAAVLFCAPGSASAHTWTHLYDSVFRASLERPFEGADAAAAAELLEQLGGHLNDTGVASNERQEADFWLELKRNERTTSNDLIWCRASFERYLLERRWYLVSDLSRKKHYRATLDKLPKDLKLDEFIGEWRRVNFEHCARLHTRRLADSLGALLSGELGGDLARFDTFAKLVAKPGAAACRKCETRDLARAVCVSLEPECRASHLWDVVRELSFIGKSFYEAYAKHMLEPCAQVRSAVRAMGTQVDNFLELARDYWLRDASPAAKKWVQYRYLCEHYIEDPTFAARAARLLPPVIRAQRETQRDVVNKLTSDLQAPRGYYL